MPDGFIPVAGRPPMWLQNGTEVGVVGTIKDHITVIGLSGTDWHDQRVIAAEVGEGAEEQGSIIDLAPSPDGMTLAMTVAVPSANRLDVGLRDLIASGPGHPVATFDGIYDVASIGWLNNSALALALRPHAEATPHDAALSKDPPPEGNTSELRSPPTQGLQ